MIRVDANQGWTPKQAVRIISMLEDANLDAELVEQPVKASDLEGMRYVTQRVYTPILADESVFTPADAIRILESGAADLVNIKLMKTGGLYNAMSIASIARALDAECMMGCMLEGNVAVTAAAHFPAKTLQRLTVRLPMLQDTLQRTSLRQDLQTNAKYSLHMQ